MVHGLPERTIGSNAAWPTAASCEPYAFDVSKPERGHARDIRELGDPPQLAASKTGSRLVHGRAAAGGWSQHRFARRRENQATAA